MRDPIPCHMPYLICATEYILVSVCVLGTEYGVYLHASSIRVLDMRGHARVQHAESSMQCMQLMLQRAAACLPRTAVVSGTG